jgi:hypothetical protein
MSVPGMPPAGSGRSHGPFGRRAFLAALAVGALSIGGGLAMALLGGDDVAATGTALLVLGLVALTCVGVLLLAERHVQRRGRPPSDL